MYILQNIITQRLEIATSLKTIAEHTGIKINSLYHTFSQKKEVFYQQNEWKIYKKTPIT